MVGTTARVLGVANKLSANALSREFSIVLVMHRKIASLKSVVLRKYPSSENVMIVGIVVNELVSPFGARLEAFL